MATKIPVTVITGFLGSGKTTLIRQVLQNNQGRRIAVLVNEFGELGIDGELLRSCQVCPDSEPAATLTHIVELTNGCLCCTVQEEFLPTMLELLKRRDSLDHILIETSGLALPKPLIKAFRWPEIRHAATVDGVITVVDCEAVATGTFASDPDEIATQRGQDPNIEHETPLQELFEDQLVCADLVLLNKTDLVDATAQATVTQLIQQEISRAVKVVSTTHGTVLQNDAPPAMIDLLLGLNRAVEDNLDQRSSHHDALGDDHDHDEEMTSTHIVLDQQFHPAQLQACLQALVEQQDIYRIKGFVAVPGKSMRLVLQGVGQRFEHYYDRPWHSDELRQTRLVFIGRALDTTQLQAQLQTAMPVSL